MDESDEELVQQMDEEEGPHEDDKGEAAGIGSASSLTPSDSPRRAKVSNFICYHHYFI